MPLDVENDYEARQLGYADVEITRMSLRSTAAVSAPSVNMPTSDAGSLLGLGGITTEYLQLGQQPDYNISEPEVTMNYNPNPPSIL